jgi:S-adenosylmethionine hydrolase
VAREDEVTAQRPVVALLTDFGLTDPYAGVMKGVILSHAPEAQLVDLTHAVPPQSVLEGAFLLEMAWRYFPAGTVFLVVVDPGVGGSRKRLAVEAHGMTFIGPDNGCLSTVLSDLTRGSREDDKPYEAITRALDAGITAVSIENTSRLHGRAVSATFEGRDVFAPAAGFLAAGGSLHDLGPALSSIEAFPAFQAPSGRAGIVIHVDTYGNLITDIRAADIELAPPPRFLINGQEVALAHTYAAAMPGRPVAIAGSSGFIEIAVPNGSASLGLSSGVGTIVEVRPRRGSSFMA